MGVNWHSFKYLASAKAQGADFTNSAMIGRLNQFVSMPKVRAILRESGIENALTNEDMARKQGYAEPLFEILGAQKVESIDASDYEDATIVADLNKPFSADLHERFDLVFDGGTIEHVFDVPTAMANLMSITKVGGDLIIHTMANNFLGHGFYQFSPEFFYRVLSPENGFEMVKLVMHEDYEYAPWFDVPDPADVRSRIELANNWCGVRILAHARRIEAKTPFQQTPQQSDYSATWNASAETAPAAEAPVVPAPAPAASGGRESMSSWVKRSAPWAVELKHLLIAKAPMVQRLKSRGRHIREKKAKFSLGAQPSKYRAMK